MEGWAHKVGARKVSVSAAMVLHICIVIVPADGHTHAQQDTDFVTLPGIPLARRIPLDKESGEPILPTHSFIHATDLPWDGGHDGGATQPLPHSNPPAQGTTANNDATGHVDGGADRTAANDVVSMSDLPIVDLTAFPDFVKAAAMAQVFNVGAGDTLYIPSVSVSSPRPPYMSTHS